MQDFALIRKHCERISNALFQDFDSKRKDILAQVAREFYPIGVAGLTKGVEELADECAYDSETRYLTTKPMDCLRKGAAGFHGNLTSPARRWFRLRAKKGVDDQSDRLLDQLTEATEWVFNYGGVYPQLYKLYEHCLCFGFGCMLVTKSRERVVKARTLRVGTYALGIGEDGKVCRVVRRFAWTAEQILKEYGASSIPDCVKEAAEKGDTKRRWTIYNLIEPNAQGDLKEYDPISKELDLSDEMIYRSIYWIGGKCGVAKTEGILEYSGFSVKPIIAPRLDYELGDTYGRGRGLDGLDLARGVQSFQYDILKISGLTAQPPVVASSEFKDTGLRLGRGQVNYARMGEQSKAMVTPIFSQAPNSSEVRHDREAAENELADLFFNTAFATIDALKNQSGVKTATEIDALVRENMERLNPVVTNFDNELLDPLVQAVATYTVAALTAPQNAPPPPQKLQRGKQPQNIQQRPQPQRQQPNGVPNLDDIEVEYVSQIHLAARQSQMSAITSYLQFAGGLAQAKPEALDLVDTDGTMRCYAKMLGVPMECIAKEEVIEATRQARAQQQQAMQQQQMLASLGDAAKIGAMPTDEGHVGGILARGLGAGQ